MGPVAGINIELLVIPDNSEGSALMYKVVARLELLLSVNDFGDPVSNVAIAEFEVSTP